MPFSRIRTLVALLSLATLAACSTPPHRNTRPYTPPPPRVVPPEPPLTDGPPKPSEIPPNLKDLEEPVPKDEPKSQYGNPPSYQVFGETYRTLDSARGFKETGLASWYGRKFQGRKTSSGEPFDMFKLTAAHKTLPLPTYVRVTNLTNAKSVIVRINDRGPFHSERIIDLSYAAATKLELLGGPAMVEIEAITPGQPLPPPVGTLEEAAKVTAPSEANYLQAAAYSSRANAAALVKKLSAQGIKNAEIREGRFNGDVIYRVVVGPFDSQQKLTSGRAKLSSAGFPSIPVRY